MTLLQLSVLLLDTLHFLQDHGDFLSGGSSEATTRCSFRLLGTQGASGTQPVTITASWRGSIANAVDKEPSACQTAQARRCGLWRSNDPDQRLSSTRARLEMISVISLIPFRAMAAAMRIVGSHKDGF